jgi:hypothetical protein
VTGAMTDYDVEAGWSRLNTWMAEEGYVANHVNTCATPGCDRQAIWTSIAEGNLHGSKAPRRCAPCCEAIGDVVDQLRAAGRLEPQGADQGEQTASKS